LCYALLLAAFALPAAAQAMTVAESGDAGSLPSSAQAPAGVPTLITGSLSGPADEDVYRVCLTGNRTFSATTEGSALADPQLFLFDASGRGIYGNDDFGSLQSTLPAGTAQTPSAAGTYYLAISSFVNRPVSQGGMIFEYSATSFPILLPIGPGGGSPVTGWTDQGFSEGAYRIALNGTRACLPVTKQECKKGGWRDFGVFKNQGDCVSFVATGGRNEPAGPKP
jgi:hypothetical protein